MFPPEQVPILFNLPEGQLQELAKRMQTLSVAAGEVIFKTGDPGGAHASLPKSPLSCLPAQKPTFSCISALALHGCL